MACPFVLEDQIRAHLEVNEGEMVTVLYLTGIVLYAVCRYTSYVYHVLVNELKFSRVS